MGRLLKIGASVAVLLALGALLRALFRYLSPGSRFERELRAYHAACEKHPRHDDQMDANIHAMQLILRQADQRRGK